MKRISFVLTAFLALVLAACSAPNEEAAALAGDWSGDLQLAGSTVPVNFSIDARGEIEDSTFNVSLQGEDFSYSVSSEVLNSQFTLAAEARHTDLGFVNLSLTGLVTDNEITGNYSLVAELQHEGTTLELTDSGSFRIERVSHAE